jgi:aminopeptidase N
MSLERVKQVLRRCLRTTAGVVVLSVATDLLFAPVAVAQQAYQPGIDIRDYDISIELPDTGAFIRADVTVTLKRSANTSRLTLDLVDWLDVRKVEVDGHAVTAPHANGKVDVPLDGAGDSVRVHLIYSGVVRDGLVARKDEKGRWTWFGDNWPDRARQWIASVDHPSDKATVTWRVIASPATNVVGNGAYVGAKTTGTGVRAKRETTWRESRPIAVYLMVIAAGPIERFDIREPDCHYGDQGQCVRQSVYVMPENKHWLPGVFSAAGPIVSLFERLVGPFPYEKLAHLQSSTRFGGMENASNIFYDGRLFTQPTINDGLIAHETAHQWFGDAVTEREWGHLWLSEGFATYFAALWTQFVRGDAAFKTEMAGIKAPVMGSKVVASRPVIDTTQHEYMQLLNENSYQKGGYVLYMLHQQLGDSVFFGALRSYYRNHLHGNALTDDLQAEFDKASGHSNKQFFDQWLRQPGIATPTIGWAYDPTASTVTLLVLQPDVAIPYELTLPIVVNDQSVTVKIPAERRATITLPGTYATRPRSITFDPDQQLLARITRL